MNYQDYYKIAKTKTRDEIIKALDQYGDSVDWSEMSKSEILNEIIRLDSEDNEPDIEYSFMAGIANY